VTYRSFKALDSGPHGAVPGPVLDATSQIPEGDVRNIADCGRANDTNTQDNYDRTL